MSKILFLFVITVMIPDCESGKGQYRHGSGHHQENRTEFRLDSFLLAHRSQFLIPAAQKDMPNQGTAST